MNKLELTPSVPNNVIFTSFDDETGLLVDVNTKRYYQLNETGAFIWDLISKGASSNDIIKDLIETYEVEPEHAISSVKNFTSQLKAQKLIAV